jgi:hypothetical protein
MSYFYLFFSVTKPIQVFHLVPNFSFVQEKYLREGWDQPAVRWLLLGKVDSIIELAAHLQQSLLDPDKPIKDIFMYLTSLPFQHEDLPSLDQIKLNRQGVALWNICANVRQTGQLLAQKELTSEGNTPQPQTAPY